MKKVVLLFPGQGSQMVGMGKWFYDHHPIAKQTFEEANDILGWNIADTCFYGSLEELTSTDIAQPALMTTSIAMYRVYMEEFGLRPFAAAGHSLGEYTALCSAGSISFEDALKLVDFRGKTMKAAAELGLGTMIAVGGIDYLTVEEQLTKLVQSKEEACIACYNGPFQVVISVSYSALEQVASYFRKIGAKVTNLQVGAAFHHPFMQSAADQLKHELEQIQVGALQYKVLSNVTGHAIDLKKQSLVEELTLQMTEPVRWNKSMNILQYLGVEMAIEMGPKTVLKQLWKSHAAIEAIAYNVTEDRKQLAIKLTNKTSRPMRYHHPLSKFLAIAASTPNYNVNTQKVKADVIEPYQQLLQLHSQLEQVNKQPSEKEVQQGRQWLETILQSKGIPLEEQLDRFSEVDSI
ncbi:MAG: ACP S-malonyltransferase [Candidatus Pristimantibacillus lignocellulolyticus]|uniref:[acyl-carrier-protein] S-malonyltransferase n=1 Tax=Candidatus Pristimantibacillus lignocellulolyticus TaxID=2994561 RepID=A0A9J6ZCQ4_9BACL|nr:MAG: ACP S-malonyltransferase [Candidatus Pristimantibacillus lignocellulolyticus]